MDYPAITWLFQNHAGFNSLIGSAAVKPSRLPADRYDAFFDISQNLFLIELNSLLPRFSPQKICDELDAVPRTELYKVLHHLAGREELKSIRSLHTAMLLYTTKGLTEEEAIARTATAPDDEILHPERILLSYLVSLMPENTVPEQPSTPEPL